MIIVICHIQLQMQQWGIMGMQHIYPERMDAILITYLGSGKHVKHLSMKSKL